jgi:hypothetical protein
MLSLAKTLDSLQNILEMKRKVNGDGSTNPDRTQGYHDVRKPNYRVQQAADTARIVEFCQNADLDVHIASPQFGMRGIPIVRFPAPYDLINLEIDNDQEFTDDPYCNMKVINTVNFRVIGWKVVDSFEELCFSIQRMIRVGTAWIPILASRPNPLTDGLRDRNFPFTLNVIPRRLSDSLFIFFREEAITDRVLSNHATKDVVNVTPDWDDFKLYTCRVYTQVPLGYGVQRLYLFKTDSAAEILALTDLVREDCVRFAQEHAGNRVN